MATITKAAIQAGYLSPGERVVRRYLDSLRGDKPAFTFNLGNIPVTKHRFKSRPKRISEGHRKAVVYTGFYSMAEPVFRTCYWRKKKGEGNG